MGYISPSHTSPLLDITMVLKLELGCKDAILDVEKLRCIRAIAELPTFNIDVID